MKLLNSISMPVRNRKYENAMQFILGAIIFIALFYSVARSVILAIRHLIAK